MQQARSSIMLYGAQAVVQLDLLDMLRGPGGLRVERFHSVSAALASLETHRFGAAIIDDAGDSCELAALQHLARILRTRSIPFALLASREGLPQLLGLPDGDPLVLRKPVDEPALRAALQILLSKSAPASG
jgi:CheY-like chemotaxis protein